MSILWNAIKKSDLPKKLTTIITNVRQLLTQPPTKPKHFYFLAVFFIITGGFLVNISLFGFEYLSSVGSIFFCWGYAIDTLSFIKEKWASDFNKKAVKIIASVVIAVPSYAMANQAINKITSLPPGNFDTSAALLSFLLVPKIIIIACIAIFFIATLWQLILMIKQFLSSYSQMIMMPLLYNKTFKPEKNENEFLIMPRIVGGFIFIFLFSTLAESYEENQDTWSLVFENIIIHTDYYEKSHCKNIAPDNRVAFLKDGGISVATQESTWHWSIDNNQICKKT